MYVEELLKELYTTRRIMDQVDDSDLIDHWAEACPDEAASADLDGVKNYVKIFKVLGDRFITAIDDDAQHFTYNDRDPIAPMMPCPKDTKIEDVPGLLTNINARLPYPLMTFSYRNPTHEGDIPRVALIEELSEGLFGIQMWAKKDGVIGNWSPNPFTIVLSARGDFRYWDGLKEYFKSIGLDEMADIVKHAEGFMFPMDVIHIEDEGEYERELALFQLDLFSFIIPYLYLLNIKNIPLKECRSVHSIQRKKIKGGPRIPFITYKKINIDLPRIKSDHHSGNDSFSHDGSTRKMHLCMGHLKEYTKDKPLFGKYVGLVWCPPHTRGSSKKGIVIKSYESKKRKS